MRVTGEEETGRARGLRGKAEAAARELFPDLGLAKRGDERPALQPLFQRPGGVLRRPGLDDEETGGVEALGDEARPVRAPPFARDALGQAPENEIAAPGPARALSECGKGKGESGGGVAIGGRLDLVQPCLKEPVEGKSPVPERGRAGEGLRALTKGHNETPTRRCKLCSVTLPLAGGGGEGGGRRE